MNFFVGVIPYLKDFSPPHEIDSNDVIKYNQYLREINLALTPMWESKIDKN